MLFFGRSDAVCKRERRCTLRPRSFWRDVAVLNATAGGVRRFECRVVIYYKVNQTPWPLNRGVGSGVDSVKWLFMGI